MKTADLIELVSKLDPYDEVEESAIRHLTALIHQTEEPWRRDLFDPGHVTASAFVVDALASRVAMVEHPIIGRLVQPGGHIEHSDVSVEAAALREVNEELGLSAITSLGVLDLDIHTFPERQGTPRHLHFDIRYHFVTSGGDLRPSTDEAPAKWISVEDALKMSRSIARPVAKLAGVVP